MRLASDWKRVLRHAWSIRRIVIAGIFFPPSLLPRMKRMVPDGYKIIAGTVGRLSGRAA
jgi:hypothetical protein